MFLSSTCCGVCLFIGFCVSDSDDSAASIVIHDNGFLFYFTWFKVLTRKVLGILVWCIDSIKVIW